MSSGLSLVLVRHGETEWTERGRLHGRLDSPLSSAGRRHAEMAATRLRLERFDALYSSPLGRAMETAAILGSVVGLTPQPIDGLAELDFGWLEGAPAPLWHDEGLAGALFRPVRALIHLVSAERPAHFHQRIADTLDWMVGQHPQGRLLVVAHWAVFSRLLGVMMDAPGAEWRRYGPWAACGISEVRFNGARGNGRAPAWEIVHLNDVSHLQEAQTA
jgi:2,3-bisphosphoglycerate-dependent phosphoglycerate mutase